MVILLPPELIQLVLNTLCVPLGMPAGWGQLARPSRHELGTCSLVCYNWTRHIRPVILASVALRSRADALTFIEFIHSTVLPAEIHMGAHIAKLRLIQNIYSVAWTHHITHHIPKNLLPRLTSDGGTTIQVESSPCEKSSLELRNPFSIYSGLPRSLPPRYPEIAHMGLTNLTFGQFEDILLFVSFVPCLGISFNSLSWKEDPDMLPSRTPAIVRNARKLKTQQLSVGNCPAVWPFIWAVTATVVPRPPRNLHRYESIHLTPPELSKVAVLLKFTFDDCRCAVCVSNSGSRRYWTTSMEEVEQHDKG